MYAVCNRNCNWVSVYFAVPLLLQLYFVAYLACSLLSTHELARFEDHWRDLAYWDIRLFGNGLAKEKSGRRTLKICDGCVARTVLVYRDGSADRTVGVPDGFDYEIHNRRDIEKRLGDKAWAISFKDSACRCYGFMVRSSILSVNTLIRKSILWVTTPLAQGPCSSICQDNMISFADTRETTRSCGLDLLWNKGIRLGLFNIRL